MTRTATIEILPFPMNFGHRFGVRRYGQGVGGYAAAKGELCTARDQATADALVTRWVEQGR